MLSVQRRARREKLLIGSEDSHKVEAARFNDLLDAILRTLSSTLCFAPVAAIVDKIIDLIAAQRGKESSRAASAEDKALGGERSLLASSRISIIDTLSKSLLMQYEKVTLQFMQLSLLGCLEQACKDSTKFVRAWRCQSLLYFFTSILTCEVFGPSSGIKRSLLLLGRKSSIAPVAFAGPTRAQAASDSRTEENPEIASTRSTPDQSPCHDCLMNKWIAFADNISEICRKFDCRPTHEEENGVAKVRKGEYF